jgi:hypothetical protein
VWQSPPRKETTYLEPGNIMKKHETAITYRKLITDYDNLRDVVKKTKNHGPIQLSQFGEVFSLKSLELDVEGSSAGDLQLEDTFQSCRFSDVFLD